MPVTSPLPRTVVAVLAALLVLTGPTATAVDAAPGDQPLDAERYRGPDRYATAARIAVAGHPDGAATAVIARGDAFPDGLAAATLAGARDAPILLTDPAVLPLATQDAFDALGTRQVVIVGGEGAVGPTVEQKLRERFGDDNVDRVAGRDRFETAAFVANRAGPAGSIGDVAGQRSGELTTAIVASGRSFPDALAAGPLAHAAGLPILLTERDTLPQLTRIVLESGIEQVVVAGGTAAVSGRVVDQIRGLDGIEVVRRVAGDDRTATAAELAAVTVDQLGWPDRTVTVALGTDFPDALALAPTASGQQAPVLLTASTSQAGAATVAAVRDRCATLQNLVIAGGELAIDGTAERQLEQATVCPAGG